MRITKLLGYGILSFVFVAAGCDTLTNPSTEQGQDQEIFTITNDVAERTIDYNRSAKAHNVEANADATDYLDLEDIIESPVVNGNKTTASHLVILMKMVTRAEKVIKMTMMIRI